MMKAYTFWLFGLPSSGKTTLASSVAEEFGLAHLDSDEMRVFLTPNPGYSQSEREFVYRSIIYTCYQLNRNGINAIVSATANLEKYRILAGEMITNLKMIYIECPITICEERDTKGLYHDLRAGLVTAVPIKIKGQNDEYVRNNYKRAGEFELPAKFDLSIDTASSSPASSINILREYVRKTVYYCSDN